MNLRDGLRHWLRKQLEARGYGAQARLAEYLHLSSTQITSMMKDMASKKSRNIQAEELLQILHFFEIKIDDPFLSLENNAPVLSANDNSGRAEFMRIFDNANLKQRKILIEVIRALAETYNIPH